MTKPHVTDAADNPLVIARLGKYIDEYGGQKVAEWCGLVYIPGEPWRCFWMEDGKATR